MTMTEAETSTPADEIPPILPEDTMAEAGRKALHKDFMQFKAYAETLHIADYVDVETIHKMRVAARRMRSIFKLLDEYYKPKATLRYRKHLKQLGRSLGAVRDIDVMLGNLNQYQATVETTAENILSKSAEKLQKQRAKALKKLWRFLSSKDHTKFERRFTKFLLTKGKGAHKIDSTTIAPYQVRHVLPVIVQEHLANIKAYDTVLTDADVDRLHELRIEFKQLRYLITHFQAVLGKSAVTFIDDLTTIQDHLGEINDLVVAQEYFRGVTGKTKSLKTYINTMEGKQVEQIQSFAQAWEKFNTRTVQRRLSDALLVLR